MYSSEECSDFYAELNRNTKDTLIQKHDIVNSEHDLKLIEHSDLKTLCCITHQSLTKHFVQLDCGHVFNYIPLYKSLSASTKSQPNYFINPLPQLTCPYCRHNTPWLLPFHKDLPTERKAHVNVSYSIPLYPKSRNCSKRGCGYLGAEFGELDKQQYNDTNVYCYTHMCKVLKKFDNCAVREYNKEQKLIVEQEKKNERKRKTEEKELTRQKKMEEMKLVKLKKMEEKNIKKT